MICFRLCWCFSGNCLQSKRCLCLSPGRFPPAIQALAHWKVPEGWLYAVCRKCRICLEIFGMPDMFGDIWQDPLKKKGSITLSFSSSQKGWLIKVWHVLTVWMACLQVSWQCKSFYVVSWSPTVEMKEQNPHTTSYNWRLTRNAWWYPSGP